MPLSTDVPDAAARAGILRLARRVEAEDGAPPLSDQTLTQLASPEVAHVVIRSVSAVTGYAQRAGSDAELVAERDALPELLTAVDAAGLLVWSHGQRSRLAPVLAERGFEPGRELHQLRRPLDQVPPDPPLADGITVRAFRPGADDAAWLALNAAAFVHHPEQGRWTSADLAARMAEPWFDPDGFLLALRDGELLGFHWTKLHPDGLGEVYVLGIAPAAQGLGLGNALLVRGLRWLRAHGCTGVLLYVDGDNPGAIHLYERAGFENHDLDVQWRRTGGVS